MRDSLQHPRRKRLPGICLHAPSGRVYVRLSGQVIYLGFKGEPSVQENYDREVQRWLSRGRKVTESVPAQQESYTVEHLVADYLDFLVKRGRYTKHGKPTSEMDGTRTAARCLCEFCGKLDVRELGKKLLRRFQEHLIEHGSVSKSGERITLTRAGVNRKLRLVQKMIAWGNDEELVPDPLAGSAKLVRPIRRGETMLSEPKRREAVSDEHVRESLEHVAPEIAAMVQIQRRTGMRPGEVCSMRWMEIDKTPVVVGGIACWTYKPATFKTEHWGKEVFYPLDPICQQLLSPYSKVPVDAFVFSPRRAHFTRRLRLRSQRKTKVPPSQASRDRRCERHPRRMFAERYNHVSYGHAIARACGKAGVPVWTPHQLRHARITEIAHDPKLGAMAASIAANHSSLAATERYIHRDRRVAFEVAVADLKRG